MLNPGAKSVLVWFYGQPRCLDNMGREKRMDPSPAAPLVPEASRPPDRPAPIISLYPGEGISRCCRDDAPHCRGVASTPPTPSNETELRLFRPLDDDPPQTTGPGSKEDGLTTRSDDGDLFHGAFRVFSERFRFRRSPRGYAVRS